MGGVPCPLPCFRTSWKKNKYISPPPKFSLVRFTEGLEPSLNRGHGVYSCYMSNIRRPKTREEMIEQLILLDEVERRRKENPLKYAKQHKKQLEATKQKHPIRALFWGNRVGKSEWGAMETTRYALAQHPHKKTIYPPIEIWCACPSYDQQKETTQKKLQYYLPQSEIKDISYAKKGVWGDVLLKNNTKLSFKSYEQGREKFQGAGKRLIWFDEEPPKDIWEECWVRTEAGVNLDIILTMTPIKGMTWVYDDIYLATDNKDIFVSEAGWDDNPFLTEKQKDQMGRGLTAETLKVRREGKFIKRTGMVCAWWNREVHLDYIEYKDSWTVVVAIDFGFSNPLALLLIGIDYDNNVFIFDGIYETQLTTPKLAKRFDALCQRYEINAREVMTIADSAQAQDIRALQDQGFDIVGIKKQPGTKHENWDEYRARKMQEFGQVVDKNSKIKVSKYLTRFNEKTGNHENWFVKEVEQLVWAERRTQAGENINKAVWSPDTPNHAIDAFSYFLVDHLDKPTRPNPIDDLSLKPKGTYIEPSPNYLEEQQSQVVRSNMWEIDYL
jgi:phage terminase large subunit-like protein